MAAEDIFRLLGSRELRDLGLRVHVSFFELYGGRCRDLLYNKNKARHVQCSFACEGQRLLTPMLCGDR